MSKRFLKIRYLIPLLFGVILILVLIGIVAFPGFNLSNIIVDHTIDLSRKQNLVVEVPPEIDENNILIKWYSSSESPLIFSCQSKWGKVPYNEGNSSFSVFYKNEWIKTVGHFAVSKYGYHNYLFNFFTINGKVDFTFKAIGPDSATYKLWNKIYPYTKEPSNSEQINLSLNLYSDSNKIENTFNFSLQPIDLKRLLTPSLDTTIKRIECIIDDNLYKVKILKTRGVSSLGFRRKSYSVTLMDSVNIKGEDKSLRKMKSFSLLNLSMDHYYFRNRIAYALLKEVKLMNIFNSYAEVKMNNETQGIYLIIEEPKKYLLDSLHASFIIRRRYEHSTFMDKSLYGRSKSLVKKLIGYSKVEYHSEKKISSNETKHFLDQYKMIYKLIHEKKGVELYQSLNEIMNMEEYMRIMAFNFIICNQDYTDEQFFYINRQNKSTRFDIMPWDFDDIFLNSPHEGWRLRNERIKDKLIFSSESDLDLVIATDSILYNKYLGALNNIVNYLDISQLQLVYKNTYKELYPFFMNDKLIKQSKLDAFTEEYNLNDLKSQLNSTYWFLFQRINLIRSKLKMMTF